MNSEQVGSFSEQERCFDDLTGFMGRIERKYPEGVKNMVGIVSTLVGTSEASSEGIESGMTEKNVKIGLALLGDWARVGNFGIKLSFDETMKKKAAKALLGFRLSNESKMGHQGNDALAEFSLLIQRAVRLKLPARKILGSLLKESVGSRVSDKGSPTLRRALELWTKGHLEWLRGGLGIEDAGKIADSKDRTPIEVVMKKEEAKEIKFGKPPMGLLTESMKELAELMGQPDSKERRQEAGKKLSVFISALGRMDEAERLRVAGAIYGKEATGKDLTQFYADVVQTAVEMGAEFEPEAIGVEMFELVRPGKNDEDKVFSNEKLGTTGVIDMMGGHGGGRRAGRLNGEFRILGEWKEEAKKMENFSSWGRTVSSWVGDGLKRKLEQRLKPMPSVFEREENVKESLMEVAGEANEWLETINNEKIGAIGSANRPGGAVAFGKLVEINGKQCFAGLRNGDIRVGIKKSGSKEIHFLRNGGWSAENLNGLSGNTEFSNRKGILRTYLENRHLIDSSFIGLKKDVDEIKFFALYVNKGDELVILTDGITDSLEYVGDEIEGSDPWKRVREIWDRASSVSLLDDLADEARRLEKKRKELKGQSKIVGGTDDLTYKLVEGCLPKGYSDDQGGVLIRIGKEEVEGGKPPMGLLTESMKELAELMGQPDSKERRQEAGKKLSVFISALGRMDEAERLRVAGAIYGKEATGKDLTQFYADVVQTAVEMGAEW